MPPQRWPCRLVTEPTCSVVGCDRPSKCRGWCFKHYQRWRSHGDPTADQRRRTGPCRILNCERVAIARGLCQSHYGSWYRHGDPNEPHHKQPARESLCAAGCGQVAMCKGYCSVHYARVSRGLDPHGVSCPHRCPICDHPDAERLDALACSRQYGAVATVAREIGVHRGTVERHRDLHHELAWHTKRAVWWAREVAAMEAD